MSVLRSRVVAGAMALFAAVCAPAPSASASSPYLVIPPKGVAEASAAYRYAAMTAEQALAELDRRGVPYRRVGKTPGVRAPIRLTDKLHGVDIHGALPKEQRATSHFEIVDARFALALDDFARLLAKHDIVEVVHFTMYRPNGPKPGSAADKRYRQMLRDQERKARGKVKRRGKGKARKATKAGRGKRSVRKGPTTKRKTTKASSRKATPKKPSPKKAVPTKAAPRKKAPPRKGARPKGKRPHSALSAPPTSSWALMGDASHEHKHGYGEERWADAKAKRGQAKRRRSKTRRKQPRKKLWSPPGTRHPAGLAIDVGFLVKRDGTRLSVAQHFHGRIGGPTCGANVAVAKSPQARELRSIVCEARDLGLFTYVLTPNYDRAHADHFHMEIRPNVRWFLYH